MVVKEDLEALVTEALVEFDKGNPLSAEAEFISRFKEIAHMPELVNEVTHSNLAFAAGIGRAAFEQMMRWMVDRALCRPRNNSTDQ